MTLYFYKARNNAGELVEGDLTASSEQEILGQLRQMEYTPVKISRDKGLDLKKGKFLSSIAHYNIGSSPVRLRDLMVFCTNISSMINAGIPLLNSLNVTSDLLTNPRLTATTRKISQLISDGSTFSDALAVFPDIFSDFFVSMVRTGETSGTMDKVLKDLVIYLEKEDNLRQTIRGMLIYPMILLTTCIGVVILIITFLMPQFVGIFTKAGIPLPLPTRILYQTGIWMKKYPLFYIPALIAAIWGIKQFFKTNRGKNFYGRFVLKMPVIGNLINKTLIARFCRTLATLLDTGVPMLMSLRILQQVLGNVVYVGIIGEVYANVEKGEGIYSALVARREFPKDVTYMISVGEKSGNIGVILNKIADFYENKVQFQVKELMVFIEPAFITLMAAVVGVIMASIILPMFDMIKTIKQ
ncbi:MAG: type II secretion system F family protein [Candidatus Omnitrophica bacterium]|nr:type II secretion system F family protein [Candidatus Omnitrophota bacterium]